MIQLFQWIGFSCVILALTKEVVYVRMHELAVVVMQLVMSTYFTYLSSLRVRESLEFVNAIHIPSMVHVPGTSKRLQVREPECLRIRESENCHI